MLTFEMLTVRGQQHSFSTHERMFLWKCRSFWDRNCLDLRGTWTPNLLIHAKSLRWRHNGRDSCAGNSPGTGGEFPAQMASNAESVSIWWRHHGLTIWAISPDICCPMFEYWLWRYRYFWNRVNIWNVDCVRATSFIFDTRTDVLVKVATHDDVIKWKHFPRYWPFVRGIHRSPVNSPHKGQWRGAFMFSLICVWINDWVNNREAGDLRCYRAHYDVIVMLRWSQWRHSWYHNDGWVFA